MSFNIHASEQKETGMVLRVGFDDEGYFMQGATEGAPKSGYGYEYLQQIAYYGGWEYEYVYASFSQQMEMLEKGEIDLMVNVSYTEERAEKINYSANIMGEETYYICVKDDSDILADDPSTLKGKKVGVTKGTYQLQMLREWVDEKGIDCMIYETDSDEEEDGMDALVTIDMHIPQGWMPIMELGSSQYYFGLSKAKPELLYPFNEAHQSLLEVRPYYAKELHTKYSGETVFAEKLTPKEETWIENNSIIKLGYYKDYMPFCGKKEDNGLTGFLGNAVECMREDLADYNIEIECIDFSSRREMEEAISRGEIQLMFPAYENYWMAEEKGYMLTNSLINSNILVIYKAILQTSAFDTIAVAREAPLQELYIADNYPDAELVYYDTILECMRAVENGKVGCTMINEQVAVSIFERDRSLRKLNFYSTQKDAGLCFAVQKKNSALLSIINREIKLLPNDLYENAISEYYFEQSRDDYKEYIKQISLLAVFIFLIVLFGIGTYLEKWEKKKSEENKKRIMAEISHDMRTPCTVVNGYLKALQSGLIPEEEKEKYIKIIQGKTEEILELLNTFHEYNLVEHPDLPLNLKKGNICAIIQQYLARRYGELELAEIKLEVDIPEEGIYCNIDEKMFNRVLNNIVNNVLKYNPPKTTIYVAIKRIGDKVRIILADDGIGLRREVKEALFTPFSGGMRAEKENGTQGSGLGLAIVHRIIVAHEGTIILGQSPDTKYRTKYEIKLPVIGERNKK
ncbi:MAG: ATP-binding protein [Lachnospiraceae bacterium]